MSRYKNIRKKCGRQLSDLVVEYVAASYNKKKSERDEIFKHFQSRWINIVTEVNKKERFIIELKREAFAEMAEKNYKQIAKIFKQQEPKRDPWYKRLLNIFKSKKVEQPITTL